jgi:transcriptional regulator with XRE-family HTH domain
MVASALGFVPVSLPTEADHRRRQRRQSWWLLVARLASGRTQADAAAALGLTGPSYGDFERGVTPPSLRQLTTLAGLFGVPVAHLADPPDTDEERLEALTGRRSVRTDLVTDVRAKKRRSA